MVRVEYQQCKENYFANTFNRNIVEVVDNNNF